MKDRVISLGKKLVQELNLEPGVDTLSRWMAHYIAEQVSVAENATGDEKSRAEKRCFETILEVWKHRSELPDGRRPFENFEPIFRALERLDPENPTPFYYAPHHVHSSETKSVSKSTSDDVQEWIDIAFGVDRAARVLIGFAFEQAASCAKDSETKSWIENTAHLKNEDVSILIRYVTVSPDNKVENVKEEIRKELISNLKSKIDKLEAFSKFSSSLQATLASELEKLSLEANSDSRTSKKSQSNRRARSKG